MKRLSIAMLALLIVMPMSAGKKRREVKPHDNTTPRMGAVVYSLPKNYVQIEIGAICTVNKPGPFAQYAERYLVDKNAIITESRVWKFDFARVKETFVPDPSRTYIICGETPKLEFADGSPMLLSVGEWEKKCDHEHCPMREKEAPADTLFHTELLGEEALTSTSFQKMAEHAAKQIFQLRDARMAIMTCDVSHQPDGAATKELLERIDREERELTALFIGKKITIRTTRCFAINPMVKKNNLIVARMSTIEGIVNADDMIGTPVYVNIIPTKVTEPSEDDIDIKPHKGYFYNVPGSADIEIRHGSGFTFRRSVVVPQNGYATWLDPSVSNIIFNKDGSIKRIK